MTSPLIAPDELHRILGEVRLYDIRWSLDDPTGGRSRYLDGHIPGAVFVDLDSDLSGPATATSGRHPLPQPADFAGTLGRLGLRPGDGVVVYDDRAGMIAARMWWMLRAIGHEPAQVLDGGLDAWVAAGHALESGDVAPVPAEYPNPGGFAGSVTLQSVGGRSLVDARAPERYLGKVEPVDPVPGHIPGAINVPATENLRPDGRMKPPGRLARIYSGLGEGVVVSCGSGVTACHTALAMEVAGLGLPEVYVGSYSEWSRSGGEIRTGPNP